MLSRRSMPRPKISRVICVNPVRDGGDIALTCKEVKRHKKLVFAKVAALRIIRGITRVSELICLDKNMLHGSAADKKFHLLAVMRRIAGGNSRNAQRLRALCAPHRGDRLGHVWQPGASA